MHIFINKATVFNLFKNLFLNRISSEKERVYFCKCGELGVITLIYILSVIQGRKGEAAIREAHFLPLIQLLLYLLSVLLH